MSHLGDLLSAVVDGELSGTELDRANAHLAACAACQREAHALRKLKQQLHALATDVTATDFTSRLLDISRPAAQAAGAGETAPERPPADPYAALAGRGGQVSARLLRSPHVPSRPRRPAPRRRGRQVIWGTLSLVVVGIGSAAFGLGASGPSGPRIAPPLEVFDLQHAASSGSMPFPGLDRPPARVPLTGRMRAE